MDFIIKDIYGKRITEQLEKSMILTKMIAFENAITQILLACTLGKTSHPKLMYELTEEDYKDNTITFEIH